MALFKVQNVQRVICLVYANIKELATLSDRMDNVIQVQGVWKVDSHSSSLVKREMVDCSLRYVISALGVSQTCVT